MNHTTPITALDRCVLVIGQQTYIHRWAAGCLTPSQKVLGLNPNVRSLPVGFPEQDAEYTYMLNIAVYLQKRIWIKHAKLLNSKVVYQWIVNVTSYISLIMTKTSLFGLYSGDMLSPCGRLLWRLTILSPSHSQETGNRLIMCETEDLSDNKSRRNAFQTGEKES